MSFETKNSYYEINWVLAVDLGIILAAPSVSRSKIIIAQITSKGLTSRNVDYQ